MNQRIPELTGLRAVAVLFVVLGHAAATSNAGYAGALAPLRLFSNGALGVRIFFVLSGFLITSLLLKELRSDGRIDLWRFYERRALRIWPASYAFLCAVALLTVAGLLNISWPQFAFAALHAWNYGTLWGLDQGSPQHLDGTWYLGHFWSLALEEQFYWVWPPLLLLMRRTPQKSLALLILAVPIVRVVSYFLVPRLRGQLGMMLHTGVDPILIGCLAAMERQRFIWWLDRVRFQSAPLAAAVALLLISALPLPGTIGRIWNATYGVTFESLLIAGLIVSLSRGNDDLVSRALRSRLAIFVGTISFSLYLWQQLFLYRGSPVSLGFPANIAEALAAATLSYWLIEKPFLRIKERLAARPQKPLRAAADIGPR